MVTSIFIYFNHFTLYHKYASEYNHHQAYNNQSSSFPLNTISTELTMTSHSNHSNLNVTSRELMTSQPPLPSPYQQQQQQNPPLPPQGTFPNLNPSTNILPPPPQFNNPSVTSYNQQPVTSYNQMTSQYVPQPPQQQQVVMGNYHGNHHAQQQGYGYQQQQQGGGYNNRAPHGGYNNRGNNRGRGKKSNGGWQSML